MLARVERLQGGCAMFRKSIFLLGFLFSQVGLGGFGCGLAYADSSTCPIFEGTYGECQVVGLQNTEIALLLKNGEIKQSASNGNELYLLGFGKFITDSKPRADHVQNVFSESTRARCTVSGALVLDSQLSHIDSVRTFKIKRIFRLAAHGDLLYTSLTESSDGDLEALTAICPRK